MSVIKDCVQLKINSARMMQEQEQISEIKAQSLVNAIGEQIQLWYE